MLTFYRPMEFQDCHEALRQCMLKRNNIALNLPQLKSDTSFSDLPNRLHRIVFQQLPYQKEMSWN